MNDNINGYIKKAQYGCSNCKKLDGSNDLVECNLLLFIGEADRINTCKKNAEEQRRAIEFLKSAGQIIKVEYVNGIIEYQTLVDYTHNSNFLEVNTIDGIYIVYTIYNIRYFKIIPDISILI